MKKIMEQMAEELSAAFEKAGYDPSYGKVTVSNRPDLCEKFARNSVRNPNNSCVSIRHSTGHSTGTVNQYRILRMSEPNFPFLPVHVKLS